MLLLRRPLTSQGSRLLQGNSHRIKYQCNVPCSIARCKSSSKEGPINRESFPSVHPKKDRLVQMKEIIQNKGRANFKPPTSSVESSKPAPEPTKRELYIVALHQAIPFVGFGIMDNAILLLAGEAIDVYLGVTLGISTMCAAAIGNIISDLSGVAFGTMIEDALLGWSKKIEKITKGRIRLPPMPKLSYEQRNLRSVRWSGQLGCAVGLTIGCIIGMFPLLFFPDDERSKEHQNGGDSDTASVSQKVVNDQNEQLKKEISQWKGKHAEVLARLKVLEKEKNDGLWDKGY